jgi:hypothetical protein
MARLSHRGARWVMILAGTILINKLLRQQPTMNEEHRSNRQFQMPRDRLPGSLTMAWRTPHCAAEILGRLSGFASFARSICAGATGTGSNSTRLDWRVRVFRFGLTACVCFAVSSCAGGDRSGDASLSKPHILCQAGSDCDTKWARAAAWVTENSGLKIQGKSDAQIKTIQSPGYDSRTLVVTITKNATSKPGFYEISFVGGCPSLLSCVPSVEDSRAGFVEFVLNR